MSCCTSPLLHDANDDSNIGSLRQLTIITTGGHTTCHQLQLQRPASRPTHLSHLGQILKSEIQRAGLQQEGSNVYIYDHDGCEVDPDDLEQLLFDNDGDASQSSLRLIYLTNSPIFCPCVLFPFSPLFLLFSC